MGRVGVQNKLLRRVPLRIEQHIDAQIKVVEEVVVGRRRCRRVRVDLQLVVELRVYSVRLTQNTIRGPMLSRLIVFLLFLPVENSGAPRYEPENILCRRVERQHVAAVQLDAVTDSRNHFFFVGRLRSGGFRFRCVCQKR